MKARLIQFRVVPDRRGDLVSVDGFRAECVFYFPLLAERGGHAHRECTQLIIATAGMFSVCVDDGRDDVEFLLASPSYGLLVPPLNWVSLAPSDQAVCMILASQPHSEADYIRDRSEFERIATFYGLAREFHPEHPASLYESHPVATQFKSSYVSTGSP